MIKNPRNASELLSNAFLSYYIDTEHGKLPEYLPNGIHSVSEMKTLISSFLKSSSYGRSLLALHTEHLKEKFAVLDKSITTRLSSELNNTKNGNTHPFTSNNKTRLVNIKTANDAPSIPGWILSSPGQYEYVVINYFTWSPGWWFPTITYGEQDLIYSLYSGSAAQNYFNSLSTQLEYEGAASMFIIALIIGEIIGPVADFVGISMSNTLSNAISGLYSTATGFDYYFLWDAYNTVYQSDYSNQNSGHKYMFLFETSNYYYPWITSPLGSSLSSFGVSGILSNGDTNSIISVEPWFSPVPALSTLYAQYVSDCSNGFGTGQWKYVGS